MWTFETARLAAAPISESDFADLSVLHHDIRVMATLGGIRTDETTHAFLREKIGHWNLHGIGMWTFRDRTTHEFVGRGGLGHIEIDGRDEVEIGYTVRAGLAGLGYGTEMARGIVAEALGRGGLTSLVAFTLPGNLASRRVMEKAGFVLDREADIQGDRQVLYRLEGPGGAGGTIRPRSTDSDPASGGSHGRHYAPSPGHRPGSRPVRHRAPQAP
jgi:RimJ/RimL family protein N-acetyltransferase